MVAKILLAAIVVVAVLFVPLIITGTLLNKISDYLHKRPGE